MIATRASSGLAMADAHISVHALGRAGRWALCAAFTVVLAACGGSSTAPGVEPAVTPPKAANTLGMVELELSGAGTAQVTSGLSWQGDPASSDGRARPLALSSLATGLDFKLQSTASVDVGSRSSGGMRYLSATYRVRNAPFCSSPGSCTPASAVARQNLTFLGAVTATSINLSAVSRFIRFDGSQADPALAPSLLPTHGMNTIGTAVDATRASMQAFRESELPAAGSDVVTLLPYGFVVVNANDGSRTLPANPADQQFDGVVTFAFKIPLQANATDDPFKISVRFLVVEDSDTRVTQSLEEASFKGDTNATARAAALGATEIVVPCGRLAQVTSGNPICDVRVAGLAGSPTATTMGTAPTTPTVVSAPSNLENAALDTATVLGISMGMAAPTTSTLIVQGSQSGRRTLTGSYAGALDGGGASGHPNQLIFKLRAGDKPFFPGETVSFTATTGNTAATGGAALAAFAGSFRTRGSVTGSTGALGAPSTISTGTSPQSVAVGDLNGDGKLDMVVAIGSSKVSVLLGDGAGGFGTAISVSVPGTPVSVAVGDFNGDGKLDVVTANFLAGNVTILLGDGTGGLASATSVAVGNRPLSVAVGDFNGDGKLDIVAANNSSNTVSVLLGDGTGGFAAASDISVGSTPASVAVGDFNGDGKLDIVVANQGSSHVSILLGDGAGGFAAATSVAVGSGPRGVAVGDFNGDGKLDIVTANAFATNVSVLLGNGNGGFAAASSFSASTTPRSVAVGDFNGDGMLDIVVANNGADNVSVLLGNGTGRFAAATSFSAGTGPQSVAVGDFNGDGKLDIVTSQPSADTVSVLAGQ